MELPIAHHFEEVVKLHPQRVALFCNGKYYTYIELFEIVSEIREAIEKNLKITGCVIAIADELNEFTYAGILAISLSGNVILPFKPDMAPERIQYSFDKTMPSMVLFSGKVEDNIKQQFDFIKNYSQLILNLKRPKFIEAHSTVIHNTSFKEMAYILFTSGSTGKPKGVPVSKKNVHDFLQYYFDKTNYDFTEEDRFLQVFDFTFDVSYFSMFVPLSIGASCYALENETGRMKFLEIIKMLQDHKITVVSMVPTVILFLKNYLSKISLPSLRYSFFIGDALYQDATVGWSSVIPNGRIDNFYGPTEVTIKCTRYIWDKTQSELESVNNIVPIGTPFPGIEFIIINDDGNLVPVGETGELCFYGKQVVDEYVGHEHENMFINLVVNGTNTRCYKTGDMCSVNKYGNLLFHGRKDFQCKINGYRIEIPEIEKVIYDIVASPVTVIAKKNEQGLNYLVGFIEKKIFNEEELKKEMLRFLPEYMIPVKLVQIENIPLNDNNKVDRKALSLLNN
jgi:amino acid adenylation domain-containing protein